MIRNYFIIAWRTLCNNKLYSIINVFGLTVGVSSCLVIYLIVQFELSFNRQVPDAERIFRAHTTFSGDFSYINRGIEIAARDMIKEQLTGVENMAFMHTYSAHVTIPETKTDFDDQDAIVITEPSYFSVIQGYQWLAGSPETSLSKPMQVVLTEEKAKKYFANDDVEKIIGKEIRYDDSLVLNVSGVVRSLPYRTDFDFTEFISLGTITNSFLKDHFLRGGANSSNLLFFKKLKSTNVLSLEEQLQKVSDRYNELHKSQYGKCTHKLQPLSDLHYNNELGIFDHSRHPMHKGTLTALSIVAAFILLIAAVNFINLETAQTVKRAKEVGVRKVMGSSRAQLIWSFLTQSILLSIAAIVLSLPLAEAGLIFFKDFVPPGVALILSNPSVILFLFGIVLVIGILAGAYPAFLLSSFSPAQTLKNQAYISGANTRTSYLRKALIVFQFGFAQILIIGTMVMISQIDFMLHKDLGFNQDAVVYFYTPSGESKNKMDALRNELRQMVEISEISICGDPPSSQGWMSNLLIYKNGNEEVKTDVYLKFGDEEYIPLHEIRIIAGRNLTADDAMHGIIINESYLKELNLEASEAIDKEVWHGDTPLRIVGVLHDFNTASLRSEVKPTLIMNNPRFMNVISVKLSTRQDGTSNVGEAISKIETAWSKVYADQKFSYNFLDETIARFYETEQRMSKLITSAMIMAIIICCLGLFGLVSFISIQRAKEISIRKVLGATVSNIILMLSSDFIKLILIAFLVASPIAYFVAQRFLQDYAFRVELNWWVFVGAGLASVIMAFTTICYHAIKSALSNPVDSLRNE